ncbi:MAG: hypothetical protein K6A44_04110 [bacterium]|nr:hypothetical protein [bacterium]
MKKFNIYICIFSLILLADLLFADSAQAWSWGKKVKPLQQEEQKNQQDDSYIFPLDEQPENLDVINDSKLPQDKMQEAGIEKVEVVDEDDSFGKNMDLMSDTVDYYAETGQYVAKGNAMLIIPEEKLQLSANEIIVDHRNYEIIGIGNVRILRNDAEYFGDYIRLNSKKESSFFKNPIIYYNELNISAKSATMYTGDVHAEDGDVVVDTKGKANIVTTSRFGALSVPRLFDPEKEFDTEDNNIRVVAKKVHVKRLENGTDDITLEHATLYRGRLKVGYSPVFRITADKDVNYIETILPEIGSHRKIGPYISPDLVFALPNAATLKAGPLFSVKSKKVGIGAFARLQTPKSKSEFMYSSASKDWVVDARYDITDNLKLRLAKNDWLDNGWMGGNMPDYGAEIVYQKGTKIQQANAYVKNFLSAGIYKDRKNHRSGNLTTGRYKWQMSVRNRKPLLAWEKYLMLGYAYDHDFTLYNTGDRYGIARIGPRLYSDLGRLYLDVAYFVNGRYGDTPYRFDRFRYGRDNIRFKGQFYLNKYISLGYRVMYNVHDKDYRGKRITENQIVAAVGTDDIKLRFGYDTVRSSSVVGLDMLLGANKTYLEFDEMKVTNIDPKSQRKEKKKRKSRL